MYNCIYSGHCTNLVCDKSCPTLVQTTYLLERNNISMNNEVFKQNKDNKNITEHYCNILDNSEGKLSVVIASDNSSNIGNRTSKTIENVSTVFASEMLTYCGICKKWKGSRLHCTVYNLKFSQYVEAIKNSWSAKNDSESLEYMKIWSSSSELLIISNIDYVNFKDFECQTLLNLIQQRSDTKYTTIIVSPLLSKLVGSGPFFGRLIELMRKVVNTK